MEVFQKENVFIKDTEKVRNIVLSLVNSDPSNLQIIADFDRTMTKSENQGRKTHSCFGVLEDSSLMPKAIREESLRNTAYYYPLEMDPNITAEQKIPIVIEWYEKNMGLIVKAHYNKKDFATMVEQSDAVLRDRCDEVLKMTSSHNIPVLIISAGLGEIIVEIIKQQSQIYPNLKIVSNFMSYDDEGYVNGINGELLHSFNKEIAPLQDPVYFSQMDKLKNVIMLGDSLGDPSMIAHLSDNHNILKIGFLNANVEASLPSYKEHYDVVITEDQTWDILLSLLKIILK